MLLVVSIGVMLLSVVLLYEMLLSVSLLGGVVLFVGTSAVSLFTFSVSGMPAEGVRKLPVVLKPYPSRAGWWCWSGHWRWWRRGR